jgi:LCP family protein required for cell wall assembly
MPSKYQPRHSTKSSGYSDIFKAVSERPHRFAWLKKKWVIVLAVMIVLLGAAGAWAAYLWFTLEDKIQVGTGGEVAPPEHEDDPFNVLLVGSDSRAGLTEAEQLKLGAEEVGGERADTLIIAHIDPETEQVTMVQFPRDLWVKSASGPEMKINETLDVGRVNMIQTVEEVTGLDINNYAKVNIAGFRDVVDEIGGVEVCIPDPIPFDPQTGIEVAEDETGMVEFDGEKAIRFVRSRHYTTGDFERIQNQQKFLAAAIDKITSPLTFLKFGTLLNLRTIAGDNVEIDDHTSLGDLYDILKKFRAFNPDNYEAYTVPNLGVGAATAADGSQVSIVQPNPSSMKVMFQAIADNESPAEADGVPDINPAEVTIGVYNGTGVSGEADAAASELEASTKSPAGSLEVNIVTDAKRQDYKKSVLIYDEDDPESRAKAEVVAGAIQKAELKPGKTDPGIDVEVIVGKNFKTKPFVQITPLPIPKPTELPEECQ